jgi:hypothetical protein
MRPMEQDNSMQRPSGMAGLDHRHIEAQLYAYAHALMSQGKPDPQIAAHLALCEQCRAVLDELLELARLAMSPDALEPPPPVAPRLVGLRRPWAAAVSAERPWFIDPLQRLWLEFSAPLLSSWQSAPLLGASRGALLYRYQQPAAPPQPGLHITIYSEVDPTLASLEVNVELADNDPFDQSGVPVALYLDGTLRQLATDHAGSVRFAQLPRSGLERIRLAITIGQSA